jgi:hypothetical protein
MPRTHPRILPTSYSRDQSIVHVLPPTAADIGREKRILSSYFVCLTNSYDVFFKPTFDCVTAQLAVVQFGAARKKDDMPV